MALRLFPLLLATAVLVNMKGAAVGIPGGLSAVEKEVTPEVQQIIDSVKADVEKELGRSLPQFKGISYKTQVVAGINYFVKVDIGENDFAHIRVYRRHDGDIQLYGKVLYPMASEVPISYFS